MCSLRVCLCTVLLSVSVHGYSFSHDGWTMKGADEVSAMEGASAVLPCTFTYPPNGGLVTGSVLWHNTLIPTEAPSLVFKCTHAGPGRPRCDEVTQKAGGGRFKFVGNFPEGDASIMVEPLRKNDRDKYRCRVELTVGSFQSVILTQLTVEAPGGNVSVVTGTVGGSATLPCVYQQSQHYRSVLMVTWMRKDPYRHIVTFTHKANESWVAENGATRFELVGDPKRGNASTRINRLNVEDSHGYLCLVEFSKQEYYDATTYVDAHLRSSVHPPYTHQYQREVQLLVQVTPVIPTVTPTVTSTYILLILIALLMLCILLIIILWKKGVFSSVMRSATFSKRSAVSPDVTGRGAQLQCDSDQTESSTYASIIINSGKAKKPQADDEGEQKPEAANSDQAESCTYASIIINSGKVKKPQADDEGTQKPEAANSEVIYAAVVTSR